VTASEVRSLCMTPKILIDPGESVEVVRRACCWLPFLCIGMILTPVWYSTCFNSSFRLIGSSRVHRHYFGRLVSHPCSLGRTSPYRWIHPNQWERSLCWRAYCSSRSHQSFTTHTLSLPLGFYIMWSQLRIFNRRTYYGMSLLSDCHVYDLDVVDRQSSRLMASTFNPFLSTLSRYLRANAIHLYWPPTSRFQITGFVPIPTSELKVLLAASIPPSSDILVHPSSTLLRRKYRQVILCWRQIFTLFPSPVHPEYLHLELQTSIWIWTSRSVSPTCSLQWITLLLNLLLSLFFCRFWAELRLPRIYYLLDQSTFCHRTKLLKSPSLAAPLEAQ